MDINFINKQFQTPNFSLYWRDKKTYVGLIRGVSNIVLHASLNALSEITFNISKKIFDSDKGLMIENPINKNIKKNMLVRSSNTDKIFYIPVQWDSSTKQVTKREYLGISWWVITNIDKIRDNTGEEYTVTLTSYDSTLRERKMFLSSGTDDQKQVLKLVNKYVTTYRIPDFNNDPNTTLHFYDPTQSENISTALNIDDEIDTTKITLFNVEYNKHFSMASELIEWFIGTPTGEFNSDGNLVFTGGFFKNGGHIITDYIANMEYNEKQILSDIQSVLQILRWRVLQDDGEYIVYFNGDSMITSDVYADVPDDTQNHISIDIWSTFEDELHTAQKMWSIGYISPALISLYRTIEDGSKSIWEWLQIFQTKFDCFTICDCDKCLIHFYTQNDLFISQNPFYLTFDNLLISTQVNTSDKEPITCSHIYSANVGDYSIAYVNPLGSNMIYNFGEYQQFMDTTLINKLNLWQSRISDFEEVFKRLGFLRLYYTQTINYWYSKMSEALDDYFSIADEINTYIKTKDITGVVITTTSGNTNKTLSTKYSIGAKIPMTVGIGLKIRDEKLSIGLTKSQCDNNKYFAQNNITQSRCNDNVPSNLVSQLTDSIIKYYKMRWCYIAVKNRFVAVKTMAQFIYYLCMMENITDIKKIKSVTTKNLQQIYSFSTTEYIPVIDSKVNSITEFLKYMSSNDYIHLFNTQFLKNTSSGSKPKGYIPSVANFFSTATKDKIQNNDVSHYYDSILFTQEQLNTLAYYLIEGSYSDEYTIFEDLDFDDTTIENRHISTKTIIEDLSNLYQKAKADMISLSKQSYDFTLSVVNMLLSNELSLQEGSNVYSDVVYLGATINAEIEPNQWEQPVILELEIAYDNPSDFSITCSNNYRQKPLTYRFEELYNDINQSSGLSLDYSSDWFSNS